MSKNNKSNRPNKRDRKRQFYAVIGLVLVAAMLITTFVGAFMY